MKRHNYNFIKKNMILKKCIWRKYEKEKTDNSSSNHLLCNIIHKIHNTPKKDTAVSTESNATTQQAETTMESDTEEYFEEDTEEEAQLKKTIAELMKEEKNTTPEGEKAVQCYIQFLKDTPKSNYDIADIDGDGTPEFFTLEVGLDAAMYRYNAKKDKVKKLYSYQLGKASVMYYSKEKHQVVFVTGDTGGGEFDTYEYTDGELKKIESLVWHNGKFEEEGYILDGEKISMEERDNYIENIREEYQSLRGEM
mgnify:CR=1 FL=1